MNNYLLNNKKQQQQSIKEYYLHKEEKLNCVAQIGEFNFTTINTPPPPPPQPPSPPVIQNIWWEKPQNQKDSTYLIMRNFNNAPNILKNFRIRIKQTNQSLNYQEFIITMNAINLGTPRTNYIKLFVKYISGNVNYDNNAAVDIEFYREYNLPISVYETQEKLKPTDIEYINTKLDNDSQKLKKTECSKIVTGGRGKGNKRPRYTVKKYIRKIKNKNEIRLKIKSNINKCIKKSIITKYKDKDTD